MNFIICAHGSLVINTDNNVEEFTVDKTNVITLAPPHAGCMYPPDMLIELRNKLIENHESIHNIKDFYNNIKSIQRATLGVEYCDKEWIGDFSKRQSYDPKKGCGLQKNTIQDKIFKFEDEDEVFNGVFGIWDLKSGINIMDRIPVEPIEPGSKYYSFSSIAEFLRMAFGDVEINFLDTSCSVIYDDYGNILPVDKRLQRRLQRAILLEPTSKKYTRKSKPKSRSKGGTKRRRFNKKRIQ